MPTGRPAFFECALCRRKRWQRDDEGARQPYEATGKTRVKRKVGEYPHFRYNVRQAQYRCHTCGHIGWSDHFDVLWMADRLTGADTIA